MSRFLVLNFQDFGLNHHITETIQSQTLFCICCLNKNVPLLNLSTCEHARFLESFPKSEVRTYKDVICYHCHEVLKKIEVFRQQVERSFKILEAESFNIADVEHIRSNNYERTKTVNIFLLPVKSGSNLTGTSFEIDVDKIERSSSNGKKVTVESKKDMNKNKEESVTVEIEIPVKIKSEINDHSDKNSKSKRVETEPSAKIKTEPVETVNVFDNVMTVSDTELAIPETEDSKVPKIKSVKLTREELAEERLLWAQSQDFLKFPHRCELCLVGFNYEENLSDHRARKHGPKVGSITCEICLQVLYPPGSVSAHNFRHYNRYECGTCGVRYTEFDTALQHYRRVHLKSPQASTRNHACSHCRYVAKTQRQLSIHKLKHERHACRDCGLVVGLPATLRRHMRVAHKKSMYKCSHCTTVFDSAKAYASHMRSLSSPGSLGSLSTGARCDSCNLTFANWHAYNSHLALSSAHVKDTMYKCNECSMQFNMVSRLGTHMEVMHSWRRSLRCKHCTKMFVLPAEVKHHTRKVHDLKWKADVIVCDLCGKAYETRKHLVRHIAVVHSHVYKKNKKNKKKKS